MSKKKEGRQKAIVGTALATVLLALCCVIPVGAAERQGKSFAVVGGEKRAVLDPGLFSGRVRQAYELAKKYPQVMDQLFCYCTCDREPFRHKSLLSCFVEDHGAG